MDYNELNDSELLDMLEELKESKKKEDLLKLFNNTLHFVKCTFLTLDNKIIHNCYNDSCNDGFMSLTDKETYYIFNEDKIRFNDNYGVFLHTDCWNYIKNNYKIELKFSDLPVLFKDDISKKIKKYNSTDSPPLFDVIDFGKVTKYWDAQHFKYDELINDKNEWMCESLLKNNSKNTSRVKKIISQLKLKNDPKRIGPNISATFYKNNIYRIGNNGKFWITNNNKWNEIKKQVISKKYLIKINASNFKIIYKIKKIGQYSYAPIFIDNFIYLDNSECSFTILAFEEDFNKIKF
jgi:hypothetical protein